MWKEEERRTMDEAGAFHLLHSPQQQEEPQQCRGHQHLGRSQSPTSSIAVIKASVGALLLFLLLCSLAIHLRRPAPTSSSSPSKLRALDGAPSSRKSGSGFLLNHDFALESADGSSSPRKSGNGLHDIVSSRPFPSAGERQPPFYTPKSKELSVFNGKGRPSSPWNSSAQSSLRTSFHFQPESNWMNDPNAPLYYNGWYHLFYQYNPDEAFWGLIYWGHAISVDLVHWLYLDLAMDPDHWYDAKGVWTGSATFLQDGVPVIMYTGSTNESVQVQNIAYPDDPTDFLLRNWSKSASNPVLVPPNGILSTDFRDPTTAWLGLDGLWRLGIGSKIDQTGIAMIYKSSDFLNWTLQTNLLHKVNDTGMWECLDFYPVYVSGDAMGVDTSTYGQDVKHVLKASMDNSKLDYYVIGTYDYENHTFIPDDASQDLGLGLRYDYGKYYASKTFYDDGEERRVLWGWINESDSLQDDIEKGWASVQAIPRQVWYDSLTKSNLLQWPVDDVLDLRRTEVSLSDVVLESGSVVQVSGATGAQWDIELSFDNPLSSYTGTPSEELTYSCGEVSAAKQGFFGPFGILVLASDDRDEQTAVLFYLVYINGNWTALVCNDQSRSSLATDVDKAIYGSFVPVLENEDTLSLRVLVDHSIVETFAQGGRTCITSRVYPTEALDDAAQLFLFNNGTMPVTVKSLEAWQMAKVYMHAYSTVTVQ